MLTRRALIAAAAVAAAGVSGVIGCSRYVEVTPPAPGLRVMGGREEVLPVGRFGMLNFPDGHISYQPTASGRRLWLSSGLPGGPGRTVALDTTDLADMQPALSEDSDAVPELVPAGGTEAFDSDYSAPGAVFPSADGSSFWLIYHGENHTFAGVTSALVPFFSAIGLASSTDGGLIWQRCGVLLTGQVPRDDQPARRDATGAGTPCVIVVDGWVYLFYVDLTLTDPDEIHVARAPLPDVAKPAAWLKYHEGSFSAPAFGGPSTPVVRRPDPVGETIYTAYPSVSWNTALGRYLMVFESHDGYWWTHSADLVQWAAPVRFLDVDGPEIGGVAFVAYPSLLSPGSGSDQETRREAFLYLGIAETADTSHSLWRVPVIVSA